MTPPIPVVSLPLQFRWLQYWVALCLLLVLSACAGPKPVEPPMTFEQRMAFLDAHALAAPAAVEGSASRLLSYLLKPARNDAEKSRLIGRWIADRFVYVVGASPDDLPRSPSLDDLLAHRKSVCEGYATAYHELAKKAGLKTLKINGHAKGSPELLLDTPDKENHAWNAVMLDGRWYGVDTTWSAGSVQNGKQVKLFNAYFLQMHPDEMLLTHFSFNDELGTQKAVNLQFNEFLALPQVALGFSETGFRVPAIIEESRRNKALTLVQTFENPSGLFRVLKAPVGYLVRRTATQFQVQSHHLEELAVVQGNEFTYFRRDQDQFVIDHLPSRTGSMYIMGRKPGDREFVGLLGYEVE